MYQPKATTIVMITRLSKDRGIRYFHSNFNIWSMRRRGNVQRIHMSTQTRANALPKNQTMPGI